MPGKPSWSRSNGVYADMYAKQATWLTDLEKNNPAMT